MDKKEVLFITNTLCQGGAEYSLVTTLNNIDIEKYNVTLFILQPILDLADSIPKGIKVIVGNINKHYKKSFSNLYLSVKSRLLKIFKHELNSDDRKKLADLSYKEKREYLLRRYLPKMKYDTVICNTLSTWASEVACMIPCERRVLVYHGSNDTHHDMLNRLINSFSKIVAVSDGVKERFEIWYPQMKGKVSVIENLIDAPMITEASKEPCEFEKRKHEITLCSCGRLSEEKGFDMAVMAASSLKNKGYEFRWLFVGDGKKRSNLEQLAKENGADDVIQITGMVSNPFAFISKCDIYIQPSYEESYGRTIKEALILGKPIVSTRTVGGELLLENGRKGILTEISVDGIVDGVELLLKDQELKNQYSDTYTRSDYIIEKQKYTDLWNGIIDS